MTKYWLNPNQAALLFIFATRRRRDIENAAVYGGPRGEEFIIVSNDHRRT